MTIGVLVGEAEVVARSSAAEPNPRKRSIFSDAWLPTRGPGNTAQRCLVDDQHKLALILSEWQWSTDIQDWPVCLVYFAQFAKIFLCLELRNTYPHL